MSIQERFEAALMRLLPETAGILVAVSGGGDSVALLRLLVQVSQRRRDRLEVAHYHHGLRGVEADRDAGFTAELAVALGLPFHLGRLEEQDRPSEEGLRRARRAFLESTARASGLEWIALGHTRDDQAETLLLNLMRGTGPAGLAAMPAVGPGAFFRPLLDFEREELREYLRGVGQPWCEDATNADPIYARNRLRHIHLRNLGRDFNPRLVEALARAANLLGRDHAYLEQEAARALKALWRPGRAEDRVIALDLGGLKELHPVLQARVLRQACRRLDPLLRIGFARTEELFSLLEAGAGAVSLPRRATARIEAGQLRVRMPPDPRPPAGGYRYLLPTNGSVNIPELGLEVRCSPGAPPASWDGPAINRENPLSPRERDWRQSDRPLRAYADADRIEGPLWVRSPLPGDRYRPLGAPGSKKLGRLFIDRGLTSFLRRAWPVVVCADKLVWVPGVPVAENFRIMPATKTVLVLEVRSGRADAGTGSPLTSRPTS